jgi:hypothetical protein
MYDSKSTFIRWHQFSLFLQNALIHGFLNSWFLQNTLIHGFLNSWFQTLQTTVSGNILLYPRSPKGEGVYCFTSVLPSVQDIFCRIFLSNCWWQESDIWSQASYRYAILWEVFLDPSDSYFLFADLVGFYTHWTYMHIFRHIFLSNCWWQRSDIWSQASYRYPISWEVFFDPSDSYFLFAEERGYHKWALAHRSSCLTWITLLFS